MSNIISSLKKFVRKHILPRPDLQRVPLETKKKMLAKSYEKKMGTPLDWNNLKTFTEKIQWMKLHYRHPDMARCVDKYEFKKYICEKLGEGYTAPLVAVWNSPEEVSIRDIPLEKFVLKSTLQSDSKFIAFIADKDNLDIDKIEKEIKTQWFDRKNLLTNSFCSAYYGAPPRVIVEEFVEEFTNGADDYKLFCFAGEPAFTYVAEDHFENGKNVVTCPITFLDMDWNVMDVSYGRHTTNPAVAKPPHFEQMVQIAKLLSKDFPFVRVDFFDTPDKLYLSELTFYPGGGFTAYYPESFNLKIGEMLTLPEVDE